MHYWLMKSEPSAYSIDDLQTAKTGCWDGVRNYQARNMMRDQMKVGDLAFFYHSNANPSGIVGVMKVIKTGYPDHTAFDPNNHHYDPKSTLEKPIWFMVDVAFVKKFKQIVSLEMLKQQPALEEMIVLRKGNRLSIMPVTEHEWKVITSLPITR